MEQKRIMEIALLLQEQRYRELATQNYMGELQKASQDLSIPDKEMFEFYTIIAERMRTGVVQVK